MSKTNPIKEVVTENQNAVEDFQDGENGAMNFLAGQVLQKTGGSYDPRAAKKKSQTRNQR
jgi:aspartyl-tRNA(Asn)/glutamyl-tRNA(Gln) amidotransferase subunit B